VTTEHPESTLPTRPGPRPWRLAAVAGAVLVFVAAAAITLAASPEPSTGTDPDAASDPSAEGWGRGPGGAAFGGIAGFAGRHGGFAAGNIEITAIDGSSVSLETVDGWTRTITITDTTTVTRDGEAVSRWDLAVGDRIRFRQSTDDDGVYSITAIEIVLPRVVGQVTAIDGDGLTLQPPGGSSITVRVDDATTYTVGGETDKALADVEVGMVLAASGEYNDDGSFDATRVRAGSIWRGPGRGGRGFGPWGGDRLEPVPSASPDTSTSAG